MAICNHNMKRVKIMGQMECAECVLVRLSEPFRELSRLLHEVSEEDALQGIKKRFSLTERDILLAGWVWQEWQNRNG